LATYTHPDFSRLVLEDLVIACVTVTAIIAMKGQADWHFRVFRRALIGDLSLGRQAALLLTFLSVGVMLVSGVQWRLSLGILLAGLTLASVIGSDRRLLHGLCLVVGRQT